jgi:hypothetical protein
MAEGPGGEDEGTEPSSWYSKAPVSSMIPSTMRAKPRPPRARATSRVPGHLLHLAQLRIDTRMRGCIAQATDVSYRHEYRSTT